MHQHVIYKEIVGGRIRPGFCTYTATEIRRSLEVGYVGELNAVKRNTDLATLECQSDGVSVRSHAEAKAAEIYHCHGRRAYSIVLKACVALELDQRDHIRPAA